MKDNQSAERVKGIEPSPPDRHSAGARAPAERVKGSNPHHQLIGTALELSSSRAGEGDRTLTTSNRHSAGARAPAERVKGIEPSPPAWKAGALPLSYTRASAEFTGRAQPRDSATRRVSSRSRRRFDAEVIPSAIQIEDVAGESDLVVGDDSIGAFEVHSVWRPR